MALASGQENQRENVGAILGIKIITRIKHILTVFLLVQFRNITSEVKTKVWPQLTCC